MNILFFGHQVAVDNMEFHVVESLRRMGHSVKPFDVKSIVSINTRVNSYVNYFSKIVLSEPERIIERKLIKYVSKENPDFIIVLLGNMVSPKTIGKIKAKVDCPIVCWCQDQLSTMGRQYVLGSPYDQVYLKDQYLVETFQNMLGDRFKFLPEACNPYMHYYERPSKTKIGLYECDITTAGNLYYYRQEILKGLLGYNMKIWGKKPDWLEYSLNDSFMDKYIVDNEKRYAFSAAKIVLNTLHYGEVSGINARAFEIAGCGGFQLMSNKSVVSDYFEPDEEVVVFDNKADMLDKVEYYIGRPEERSRIAKNGMQRCHTEHTYSNRLQVIIDNIKKC